MQGSNSSSSINIANVYNNIHSILHFVDKDNPTGGYPANPSSDGQYVNWEYGVQQWNKNTFGALLNAQQPKEVEEEDENTDDSTESNRSSRSDR